MREVHARLLADAGLTGSMVRTADGAGVHVMVAGEGTPVVLVHGSGSPGVFWLPLVRRLTGMRVIVVDRPGFGLSDPVRPSGTPAGFAADWLGRLLDALGLASATMIGHSMGGLWSLHLALSRPERVRGLVLLGAPSLPGTRAPLPFRLMGTPGVRALLAHQRETPASVLRFASFMGEADTLPGHPDLVDLMVACGNDPVARAALHAEVRALITPWALCSRDGFRARARVTDDALRSLRVPTLLLGGTRDPVGDATVARRTHRAIPGSELHLVEGGHAPWLGQAAEVAGAVGEWVGRLPH